MYSVAAITTNTKNPKIYNISSVANMFVDDGTGPFVRESVGRFFLISDNARYYNSYYIIISSDID